MSDHGQALFLRGGRVIDPLSGRDAVADVLVRDGKVEAIGVGLVPKPRPGDRSGVPTARDWRC